MGIESFFDHVRALRHTGDGVIQNYISASLIHVLLPKHLLVLQLNYVKLQLI